VFSIEAELLKSFGWRPTLTTDSFSAALEKEVKHARTKRLLAFGQVFIGDSKPGIPGIVVVTAGIDGFGSTFIGSG
jgi:hypothetical protein